MNQALLSALVVAVVSVAVVMHPSSPPPASAQAQFKKSTKPLTPQQAVPVEPGTQGTRIPGAQLLTHCNSTCMCSGNDCSREWREANCKGDSWDCSGDATSGRTCSCVNKASQK